MLKTALTFIFTFTLTTVAIAAGCEKFSELGSPVMLCWNNTHKGYFSEFCSKRGCDAVSFFNKKINGLKIPESVGGQNPSALVCHALKLKVAILRDAQENEQSFCVFPDKSLGAANAIERGIE